MSKTYCLAPRALGDPRRARRLTTTGLPSREGLQGQQPCVQTLERFPRQRVANGRGPTLITFFLALLTSEDMHKIGAESARLVDKKSTVCVCVCVCLSVCLSVSLTPYTAHLGIITLGAGAGAQGP